jgi:hypothetical protein
MVPYYVFHFLLELLLYLQMKLFVGLKNIYVKIWIKFYLSSPGFGEIGSPSITGAGRFSTKTFFSK